MRGGGSGNKAKREDKAVCQQDQAKRDESEARRWDHPMSKDTGHPKRKTPGQEAKTAIDQQPDAMERRPSDPAKKAQESTDQGRRLRPLAAEAAGRNAEAAQLVPRTREERWRLRRRRTAVKSEVDQPTVRGNGN